MLYLVGLGFKLGDINLEGYKAIKKSNYIFLENYTNFSPSLSKSKLEKFFNKKIEIADRSKIENKYKEILNLARENNVSILFIGDPLFATTHSSLIIEAKKLKIKYKIIHNISIINLIGKTGLFVYKFGKVGSIPLVRENYNPTSFVDVLKQNKSINAHTLYLLEIDKTRFVSPNEALKRLLDLNAIKLNDLAIVISRGNTKKELIVSGEVNKLLDFKFGNPPHSLIIPSNLNPIELENLKELTLFL